MPKVRGFLEWVQRERLPFDHPGEVDRALATYLDWQCYGLQLSPSIGSLVMYGLLCLAPELRG
eukprot:336469-Lingulodinium_polyedra.AAC.1